MKAYDTIITGTLYAHALSVWYQREELVYMASGESYHYTTSEISRYYSLSGKGLSFYEEKGIISPGRIENGKYREFSLTDCYHLYASKFYSNCGFSLCETAELIQRKHLACVEDALQKKSYALQQKIIYEKLLLSHIERITQQLSALPQLIDAFSFVTCPSFYRLFVRRYDLPHESTREESEEFAHWNSDIPINVASLEYSLEELAQGAQRLNAGIGNIILENDFYALGYSLSDRVNYLPARPCIYTVVRGSEDTLYQPDRLEPALAYIEKNHYRLCGNPFTSMLLVANTDQGPVRYDEAWFPVAPK